MKINEHESIFTVYSSIKCWGVSPESEDVIAPILLAIKSCLEQTIFEILLFIWARTPTTGIVAKYLTQWIMTGNISKYVSICPPPTPLAAWDKKSIFKRSVDGLNSEISFSNPSCLIYAKEFCLNYYLPIVGGRREGFMLYPEFELRSFIPFHTMVTVTLSSSPNNM